MVGVGVNALPETASDWVIVDRYKLFKVTPKAPIALGFEGFCGQCFSSELLVAKTVLFVTCRQTHVALSPR